MKKQIVILLALICVVLCSCTNNALEHSETEIPTSDITYEYTEAPDDFNIEYAKKAVANYYLHRFIMINEDTDITYIGYDKDENRAVFFVADTVKEIMGDADLRVGKFYVIKSEEGYYFAQNEDNTDTSCGTYYYKTSVNK